MAVFKAVSSSLVIVLLGGLLTGAGVPRMVGPALRNGSFNDPFIEWTINGRPEFVAQHWTPYVQSYSAVVPEFKRNSDEYRDPPTSQWVWSSYNSYQCGLYQTVGDLIPGESYTFQVWILSIYGAAGGPPVPGEKIGKQLAVDLRGGTDWAEPGLLRGAEDFRDRRAYFAYLSFTAETPTATVFIHINNLWPGENCQALWDDAQLYPSPVTTTNYSRVWPLPAYVPSDSFPVQWGLEAAALQAPPPSPPAAYSYDVQYRVDDGPWTTWLTNTFTTGATFGAGNPVLVEPRRTYAFRCRAHDATGGTNEGRTWGWVEQYPEAPDAQTTAGWIVAGRVNNNAGEAVPGAQITVTGDPIITTTTGAMGEFRIGVPVTGTYSLVVTPTLGASAYGDLPPHHLPVTGNVTGLAFLLPPADDVVQNGDFEADPPLSGWHLGGAAPPTVTVQAHTGQGAAWLGCEAGPGVAWLTQTVVISDALISPTLSFACAFSPTAPADAFDVWVQAPGGTVSVTHTTTPTAWTYIVSDVSGMIGPVTLNFRVQWSSAQTPVCAWVDEVHLGSRAAPFSRVYLPLVQRASR